MSSKVIKHIISLIKQGDMEGIALLYSLYFNKLYSIAFSILKDHQKSEDAVHNVILKFIKMDKSLLPNENEIAWLYKVVQNASIDVVRKERKMIAVEDIEPMLPSKDISEYVDMDGFNDMIKGLDDKRKSIITLRVIGDYQFKDIAKMLSINVNTVRWLYNTGISKLKKALIALGSTAIAFLMIFITSLIVEIAWLNVEFTYLLQVFGLSVGGYGESFSSTINVHPNTILLLYSGLMTLTSIPLFAFCYHNAYELPTKAKIKNKFL